MKFNVHAGHNPSGKIACGATGLLDESKENRLIAAEIIRLLKAAGHTVYDCTVDNGTSQNDVLKKIAAKCNAHTVDFDFSIHFNSGRNDKKGDGSIGGFEVWVSGTNKGKGELAARICTAMEDIGFKNRGTKTTSSLYILNHTNAPALLLEVCFVDDRDDYNLYNKLGYKKIAEVIAGAIMGKAVTQSAQTPTPAPAPTPTPEKSSSNQIAVDGMWGSGTTKRLQQILKTTEDGIVSHQYSSYKDDNPGLAGGWQWEKHPNGNSALIMAIQKKVGATVDGHIGPKTIKAMQKWLGTTQDGKVSKPSAMVKALQKWCNKQ